MRLAMKLGEQLEGRLEIDGTQGTKFKVICDDKE